MLAMAMSAESSGMGNGFRCITITSLRITLTRSGALSARQFKPRSHHHRHRAPHHHPERHHHPRPECHRLRHRDRAIRYSVARARLKSNRENGKRMDSRQLPASDRPSPRRQSATRILVVEDDEPLRELLQAALTHEGYQVTVVATGVAGLELAGAGIPDLVVLDVNLPDVDGFELCQRLRRDGNDMPVVFLTARDARTDLRMGLATGDDYLTKPFSLEELVLRIEAVLRRSGRASASQQFRCDALRMDDSSHRVHLDETEIALTPTEYRLLRFFLHHVGVVLSKETILREVWEHGGYHPIGGANSVEVVVGQLRRKLTRSGQRTPDKLIHTVRGFGYVLRATEC